MKFKYLTPACLQEEHTRPRQGREAKEVNEASGSQRLKSCPKFFKRKKWMFEVGHLFYKDLFESK